MSRGRVLFVGVVSGYFEHLRVQIPAQGFTVQVARTIGQTLKQIEARTLDTVLLLQEDDPDHVRRLCLRITDRFPGLPVVVVDGVGSLERAVGAMRAGAYDYVSPPLHIDTVSIALDRAVQHRRLRQEVRSLRQAVQQEHGKKAMMGGSPVMQELNRMVDQIARSSASVLIHGETGTGKEVAARTIHSAGLRRDKPFVAVNCAAMPEALLESELFGHVRGAFTDARTARKGLFVQAEGGTIFLDEIGDMPLALQPKLLRALQERTVKPVGADHDVPFDVRVIAASNHDLELATEDGQFRRDLYFRINVIQLDLPPLRERGSDILMLAHHFLALSATRADKEVYGITPDAQQKLMAYRWPGNVRELENCIERAVALTHRRQISVDDLPIRIRTDKTAHVRVEQDDPGMMPTMDVVEERYIRRVLAAVGGNKARAARVLGFDRKTLYRKMLRFGISSAPPKEP